MPAKQTITITRTRTRTRKSSSKSKGSSKRGNQKRCPSCGRYMWMGNHLDIKHKIQKIDKRSTFDEMLNESMLNDKEKQLLTLYYVNGKTLDYIADTMGYSLSSAKKIHKRALQKIESLL